MDKKKELLRIFPGIQALSDPSLRDKVIAVWCEIWEISPWDSPESCPFNPDFPDISLATHINSLWALAQCFCDLLEKYYPFLRFNRDLLNAGLFLHDASKMVEMGPGQDGGIEYSDLLDYLSHSVYGAMKAHEKGLSLQIQNLILAHTKLTGQRPATPEAVLLHYLDYGVADVLRAFTKHPLLCEKGSQFRKS